jgi:O-antigen/teichoic acid export membrane protein
MSNRYFLQEYQTLDDVGMYSLGAKLAGIIPFLFTEPIKKAFSPYLYEYVDQIDKCKKTLSDFARIFFVGLSIVALAISLFSRELIMIMSDQSYHGSHNIVFILSVSYLFLGLSGIVVLGIHITRKTWIITIIWPISAISNIALNIWLIPLYARMGAAVATMLSVVVIIFLYLFALHKVFPIKFDYIGFVKVVLLMLFFNYAGTFIVFSLLPSILIKIVLMIFFIFLLLHARIFKPEELKKGKEFLYGRMNKKIII